MPFDIAKIPAGKTLTSLSPVFEGFTQVNMSGLTSGAKATVDAYRPLLDQFKVADNMEGPKMYRDRYRGLTEMMFIQSMKSMFKDGGNGLLRLVDNAVKVGAISDRALRDATISGPGTGILPFARQIIAMIARAYPKMIGPQLFPTVPLDATVARVYWITATYGTPFASSTPNLQVGDPMYPLQNFQPQYPNKPQLEDANLVDLRTDYMTVSAQTKRLASVHSIEAEEDMNDLTGMDLNQMLRDEMEFFLATVADYDLITTALASVPPSNVKVWNAQPTLNSTTWMNQLQQGKDAYNQTLWTEGAASVSNAIAGTQYVRPNWAIAGPKACDALSRTGTYFARQTDEGYIIQTGPARDVGTMDSGAMRVIRWDRMPAQYQASILFGYMPQRASEPAIRWLPKDPIRFLGPLTFPRQAKVENGAYTRYGIAAPDPTQIGSEILGTRYGRLDIQNSY